MLKEKLCGIEELDIFFKLLERYQESLSKKSEKGSAYLIV